MLSLALTGNIASGKSAVAAILSHLGAWVIDADRIVHELQRSGTPVFYAIVRRFGSDIVGADGELDRAALRQQVLADDTARRDLEAIVHPAVSARREQLLAQAKAEEAAIVVSDIPLLFEVGAQGAFDGIILVDAPLELRRQRLLEQRGLDPAEVARLLAVQWPPEEKRKGSTWIIENDGGLEQLEARTRAVWREIQGRARA